MFSFCFHRNASYELPDCLLNEAESVIVNSACGTSINSCLEIRTHINRGTWLAQSVEHATLDLGVVTSSPTLGVEIT